MGLPGRQFFLLRFPNKETVILLWRVSEIMQRGPGMSLLAGMLVCGNVWRHVWLSQLNGGSTGIWWIEPRAVGKHPA